MFFGHGVGFVVAVFFFKIIIFPKMFWNTISKLGPTICRAWHGSKLCANVLKGRQMSPLVGKGRFEPVISSCKVKVAPCTGPD